MKAGAQIGTGISVAVAALIAFASIFAAMASQPQSSLPTGTDIGNSEKPDASAPVAAETTPSAVVQEQGPKREEEKAPPKQTTKEETRESNKLFSGATTLDYRRIERNMLALVNDHREELGLGPVKWDYDLAGIAIRHSISMITNGYFDHADPLGVDVVDRYRFEGISCSFEVTNENAEGIYRNAESVLEMTEAEIAAMAVDGWGHIIENPEAGRMGAGFAIDSEGKLYSTINLC